MEKPGGWREGEGKTRLRRRGRTGGEEARKRETRGGYRCSELGMEVKGGPGIGPSLEPRLDQQSGEMFPVA